MSTSLSYSGASYSFNKLVKCKQFTLNSKDWWWAKPLEAKPTDKPTVIFLQIAIFL